MRLKRNKDGTVVLTFPSGEAALFKQLCAELRALFAQPDYTHRAMKKLFPRLAEDPKTDTELRQLLQDDHCRQKLERAETFSKALDALPASGGPITLTPAELENLLTVLNDLRFIYADALDIEHDNWKPNLNPFHPRARATTIYLHLSALQELILERGFGET